MNKINTPLVSIVIPVYNVEKGITACLESCIKQTLQDIEIIIVDDCGTDNSMNIVNQFSKKDSRIKIIHNDYNLGLVQTRINGVKYATGEYITFLDSDDYLELETCEKTYNKATETTKENQFKKLNGPDIIFFDIKKDINQQPLHFSITKPLFGDEILYEKFVRDDYINNIFSICVKLYKASFLKYVFDLVSKHIGDKEKIVVAEDAFLSLWVFTLAKSSIGIEDALYFYCVSDSSITLSTDENRMRQGNRDRIKVIKELRKLKKTLLIQNKYFFQAQKNIIKILGLHFINLHIHLLSLNKNKVNFIDLKDGLYITCNNISSMDCKQIKRMIIYPTCRMFFKQIPLYIKNCFLNKLNRKTR